MAMLNNQMVSFLNTASMLKQAPGHIDMLKSPVFNHLAAFRTSWIYTGLPRPTLDHEWPLLGVKIRRKTMVVPATSNQTQWCLEDQGVVDILTWLVVSNIGLVWANDG